MNTFSKEIEYVQPGLCYDIEHLQSNGIYGWICM